MQTGGRHKIINDPVHGFITIPPGKIAEVVAHPWFQRLRRIKQMGIAHYIYPGALHTRFHHALGALHLMGMALDTLREKGHHLWDVESEAARLAILLHDIGHGPLSHALEHHLVEGVSHEALTLLIMKRLNTQLDGLDMAIDMFQGRYPRPFFHQLVSSQLDMDRLDYLKRDCFFTGVTEGEIGSDRIIRMLDLHDNHIVVEEKGMYSLENFLSARRHMYWQVYYHKTAVSAEKMITLIIRRVRELFEQGGKPFLSPGLEVLFTHRPTLEDFEARPEWLDAYLSLDDMDIWYCLKQWALSADPILALLSRSLLDRKLFAIQMVSGEAQTLEAKQTELHQRALAWLRQHQLEDESWAEYLVSSGGIVNHAYYSRKENIHILRKDGQVVELSEASDLPLIRALSEPVNKNYICWYKPLSLSQYAV